MASHKDEVHPSEINRKLTLSVLLIAVAIICILIYLIVVLFPVNPLISAVLVVVLLMVAGLAIFTLDIHSFREVQ